ncbi:MAG: L,D-transpeptidase [Gammaproteobacteria bacterium]|nr:L,D-transpeptidase [Gammaproteobacteria bacterium]
MAVIWLTPAAAEARSQSFNSKFSTRPVINQWAANTNKKSKRLRKAKRKIPHHTQVFPNQREAQGVRVLIVSPRNLAWGAYNEDGQLVRTGRASGGKAYCADVGRACRTPRGVFKVYRKGSKYCKSSKFPLGRGGAPMPYCMFFRGGFALHGSPDVPMHNASHGCVRLKPHAAKWLHQNFVRVGTVVIVTSY